MDRRDFVRNSAAVLAPAAWVSAQDKKPRVGVIGCGWFGKFNLEMLMAVAGVEVVGLADVDRKMLDEAAKWVEGKGQKRPATFDDYQTLLREKPDIVIVGTPDHWHCLPTIHAIEAGADVYVEKPV